MSSIVAEQVRKLPDSPGVYLMKDSNGKIIYVGKAASLKHRARSYFGSIQKLSPKIERMVDRIADVEYFVTSSEQEALILEMNLIKRFHPYYNVRLRDDKTFPYLKISLNEEWPRIYFTRRVVDDGGRYFGPFASARSVRQTLKALKRIFPFRSCSKPITGTDSRACLEYHLNQCVGPCIGAINQREYKEVIKQVILFLEGKEELVIKQLEGKMNHASESLQFERAAILRDQIQAIHRVIEGQRIATKVRGEQDAIAFAQDSDQACVQVFFIRGSKLIGRESFILQGTEQEEPRQIMTDFVKQFYSSSPYIPPLLLLQHPVYDENVIKEWLEKKRGGRVDIQVPQRGSKKELVDIVAENARQGLEQLKIKKLAAPEELEAALAELQSVLNLPRLPERMEGYDISNIQGTLSVGSMVVFEQGKPKPAHYRRFRIRTVAGADDYAMLQEVLRRRFKRVMSDTTTKDTWTKIPDLVLVDGGRGQLNAALSVMKELGAESIPVTGLAKENEEIFTPQSVGPIRLPGSSPALQLLQHLRDEAHRFALGYHQRLRQKEGITSVLDTVPGIGPVRKRSLLSRFGSVRGIREATMEEVAATQGMSKSLAQKLKEYI